MAKKPTKSKRIHKKVKSIKRKKRAVSKKTKIQKFKEKLLKSKNIRKEKIFVFWGILLAISLWIFWDIPSPTSLTSNHTPISTKLFDRNGKLIYEIYADKRSTPVNLDEIPTHIKEATISIEDKDFYKHHGVDLMGIMRAAYNTVFKRKLQGGSTLTQQLVKQSLLTPERTVRRKIREIALTLIVETIYSKDQILTMYLNQIPYGSTAYGIGAAADLYFGKNVKDLDLSEAAMLAGLTQAPTKYSPFGAHPEYAKERQKVVLDRMIEDGYISEDEAKNAEDEQLIYAEQEHLRAPHFALWVKEQLADKYGDKMVEQGGLRVTTTLDLDLQEFAENAVATEVGKLAKQHVGNGAILVTRPKSGEILAMVGSKDYFAKDTDGKVNIIFAHRQPGSSIKPLNYALAFKDKKITPSTPLADVSTCFKVVGQASYCPVNYDGGFHGAVQARFALGNSYNIPAVRVLALNGLENFINFAKDMGITTFTDPANYGLSLTLGGGEVRPYDMTEAFGVFANEGVKVPLISIVKVTDWKGKVLEEKNVNTVDETRVINPDVSYLISHILLDNNARVSAFGDRSFLVVSNHPEVSVKTGTTNDRRDNWTIGYTSHVAAVSWVGNNDNSPMSGAVSGVSGASPIWNKVIKEALDKAEDGFYNEKDKGHAWPQQPDDVVGAAVCTTTGNLPDNPDSPGCPTRFEYFLHDKIGAGVETGNKDLQIDKTTSAIADPNLPPEFAGNIEAQNHSFFLDPLGTIVCLDCIIPTWNTIISYPLSIPRQTDNSQN